jgi:hypothetical protein
MLYTREGVTGLSQDEQICIKTCPPTGSSVLTLVGLNVTGTSTADTELAKYRYMYTG